MHGQIFNMLVVLWKSPPRGTFFLAGSPEELVCTVAFIPDTSTTVQHAFTFHSLLPGRVECTHNYYRSHLRNGLDFFFIIIFRIQAWYGMRLLRCVVCSIATAILAHFGDIFYTANMVARQLEGYSVGALRLCNIQNIAMLLKGYAKQ